MGVVDQCVQLWLCVGLPVFVCSCLFLVAAAHRSVARGETLVACLENEDCLLSSLCLENLDCLLSSLGWKAKPKLFALVACLENEDCLPSSIGWNAKIVCCRRLVGRRRRRPTCCMLSSRRETGTHSGRVLSESSRLLGTRARGGWVARRSRRLDRCGTSGTLIGKNVFRVRRTRQLPCGLC